MHFITALALFASMATAQSTFSYAGTTSACAAQPVLEACLASTQAIASACLSTDYGCLCQKWTDVETCFLQCPNDARYASVSSQQATYCNDAAVYDTTTTSAISKAVSSASSAPVTASATNTGTESAGAVAVATSTSSTASATSTAKSGAEKVVPGLMGFAGLVAALF